MKKFNLACCLLLFFIAAQAQKHEPVNPQKDKQDFEGYTIRLLPTMDGTYGYDILKGNQPIIHQDRNPFTFSSKGLARKEDAFKLAQWQIQQRKGREGTTGKTAIAGNTHNLPPALAQRLQMQGSGEAMSNQRISPKIAQQLQITILH